MLISHRDSFCDQSPLWSGQGPVDSIHPVVEATSIAQVVTCAIPPPQWGGRGTTVDTLPCLSIVITSFWKQKKTKYFNNFIKWNFNNLLVSKKIPNVPRQPGRISDWYISNLERVSSKKCRKNKAWFSRTYKWELSFCLFDQAFNTQVSRINLQKNPKLPMVSNT